MESDDDADDARSADRRGNVPAGPPPPQPVNAAAEERDDAAAHGDDDEAAANAADADDGDTDTRSVTSSDTPPVQRIKRTMVDELLTLENANGERRWRIWTSKRWLIWADGSCVGHTYAAGRASLQHSPDGHGTLTRLGRSMIRRMKTSTTWSSVMMPYELYNAAWLWSGGFRCRRTTRSSAKGNWVDDRGLSCGASARPRGRRRCAMRDTACACSPGGAGSSKFTLLWRLHAGQHKWPAGRSRYQRAQLFQWPDPGLCALCAHLRRPWQPTLIHTKLPSCFPNLKPQPPHDSPIGQASWSFRHATADVMLRLQAAGSATTGTHRAVL